jgi:membrane-associated phospholipid phosphatase
VAAAVLAAGVIALMGWDRVYDGAHWPSDVLGGYATGTALLIIALMLPRVAVRLWHRYVGHSDGRGLG